MFLSGGFAINDSSWTNRKISFYSDCTFSQIISVACKIPQLQNFKRSKAERPLGSLHSPHTRTIVWLSQVPFMTTRKCTFIITKLHCENWYAFLILALDIPVVSWWQFSSDCLHMIKILANWGLELFSPMLATVLLNWFSVSNTDSQNYQINPKLFIRVASEYIEYGSWHSLSNLTKGREKISSSSV